MCETLLAQHPDVLWLRCCHADILLKSGDTHRAGRVLQALSAEYPDNPRVLGLAGERHRLEGRTEEAVRCYRESLRRREAPYLRVRLIDALLRLNRIDEAGREVDKGLEHHPRDPYLLRRRARILTARDEPDKAAEAYARAAALSSSSGRDYADGIKLKLQRFSPEERLREVERLLSVAPHSGNPHLHALAAELAIDQGDVDSARSRLLEAERLSEQDVSAMKRVGYLYNRIGDHAKVLDTLGRGFVAEPRDVVAQQVLFAAARKTGAWTRLRTVLVLAYDRHPGFHKLNGLIKKVDNQMQRGSE